MSPAILGQRKNRVQGRTFTLPAGVIKALLDQVFYPKPASIRYFQQMLQYSNITTAYGCIGNFPLGRLDLDVRR